VISQDIFEKCDLLVKYHRQKSILNIYLVFDAIKCRFSCMFANEWWYAADNTGNRMYISYPCDITQDNTCEKLIDRVN